ncbi:MAG: hypothetical protein IPJ20_21615 [Flammeovirgaceae bacterium]|nr:hypothetical protein [Flammeovirgaceae bacterium]
MAKESEFKYVEYGKVERKQIDELVAKYNEGLADPAEIKLMEKLIAAGEVDLTSLHELAGLD